MVAKNKDRPTTVGGRALVDVTARNVTQGQWSEAFAPAKTSAEWLRLKFPRQFWTDTYRQGIPASLTDDQIFAIVLAVEVVTAKSGWEKQQEASFDEIVRKVRASAVGSMIPQIDLDHAVHTAIASVCERAVLKIDQKAIHAQTLKSVEHLNCRCSTVPFEPDPAPRQTSGNPFVLVRRDQFHDLLKSRFVYMGYDEPTSESMASAQLERLIVAYPREKD